MKLKVKLKHRRTLTRCGPRIASILAVLALLAGLGITAAAGASQDAVADAPEEVRILAVNERGVFFEGRLGHFYGDLGDPTYTALAGDPIETLCTSDPPRTFGVSKQNDDGTWTSKIPVALYRSVYIYENPPDKPVEVPLPAVLCPALAEGAEPPEPFAVGWVRQSSQATTELPYWNNAGDTPQPPGSYDNSITGWAWDEAGQRYRVRGVATYELPPDGPPNFDDGELTLTVKPVAG